MRERWKHNLNLRPLWGETHMSQHSDIRSSDWHQILKCQFWWKFTNLLQQNCPRKNLNTVSNVSVYSKMSLLLLNGWNSMHWWKYLLPDTEIQWNHWWMSTLMRDHTDEWPPDEWPHLIIYIYIHTHTQNLEERKTAYDVKTNSLDLLRI